MVRRPWEGRLAFYYLTLFSGEKPFDLTHYNSCSVDFLEHLPYYFPKVWALSPKTVTRGGSAAQQAPNTIIVICPKSLSWCNNLCTEFIQQPLRYTDIYYTFFRCLCINYAQRSDALSEAPSCLSTNVSYNWVIFPLIIVVTMNASSIQGWMHALSLASHCCTTSTCSFRAWASLILAKN